MIYNIAQQYTKTPGIRRGEFSGEDFRENILKELLKNLKAGETLTINLDGGFGYSSSFLEESFGGLVREYNYSKEELLKKLKFISEEEKGLPEDIKRYIEGANYKRDEAK
jgi:hypothetical protein|nr:MAG TPA: protein of unknown function DUF4325 [Caudoviricetes sp.]